MRCQFLRSCFKPTTLTLALALTANFAAAAETGELTETEMLRARLQQLEQRQAELEERMIRRLPATEVADPKPGDKPAEKAGEKKADAKSDAKPAEAPKPYEVGSDLVLKTMWKDGFYAETANKDFKVHIGGRLHHDWVFFDQDPELRADTSIGDLDDGVFFRRMRVQVDGSMYEVFSWDVDIDVSSATDVRFDDVHFTVGQLPYVGNCRIGNLKTAFGLESMNSSKFLTFLERGTPNDAFLSEFDPGVLLYNTALEDSLYWAFSFTRIDPEDDGIDFGDGEYAAAGRVAKLLYYDEPTAGRYLLHVGGSYQHRDAEFLAAAGRDVVRFRGRPEIRAGQSLPRFIDTGNIAADSADLLGAEASAVWGPLSFQAEYVGTTVNDAVFPATPGGTPRGDATFHGFYAYTSFFLTGENRVYDRKTARYTRVKPNENFWLVRTGRQDCPGDTYMGTGAWEVAARYSRVDLNDSGINGGDLEDVTLGLNWYLNPNLRVQWNYLWMNRSVAAPLASGEAQAVGMRFALDY